MRRDEKTLHWEEVHRRLHELTDDAAREHNEQSALEKVFAQRARRLAANRADPAETQAGEAVLSFRLGQERYGIALGDLAEVLPLDKWVRVPGMPEHLLGVMNLRGEIRPVLNLHRLLSIPDNAAAEQLVLFLRGRGQEVGLRIDAIDAIAPVDLAALSLPSDGAALLGRYVKGMTTTDVILLDIDQIFALDIFRDVVAGYSTTP
ncbi:MAG TPA: chemotaxis protein CheW [Patescibacteria group bacterium]|nr:chemotaxis protein CheW [Patescibacteria group bacterium]